MSSPLAIAAVTAALKDLLNNGLLDQDLSVVGNFSVTATPPDRITVGQNEPNQLNLFLYRVTPNPGWRNADLPVRDARGTRLRNPLLALDLHYLLSAYGADDLNAEVLLGYAMHLLHETTVLSREQLRTALGQPTPPVDGSLLPSPFGDLSAVDLADQIELIKIAPVYLNTEDLSKLWTAMQARYRPTMAYMVSVVLIQGTRETSAAPPVLQQGADDRGPVASAAPFPTLAGVRPAGPQALPAMRLGDDLVVTGSHLGDSGAVTARLENARAGLVRELTPVANGSTTELRLHVPDALEDANAMSHWAVGMYALTLKVTRPDLPAWTTNAVPIALAPTITVNPLNAGAGSVQLILTCAPRLLRDQEAHVRLIFGTRQVAPESIATPGDPTQPTTLAFTVPGVAPGEYLVRLRVSGVDSLPVVLAGSPPKLMFDPQQKVTVA